MELFYLCGFAFLAGFVDSVVGGGGLIQLPALFLFLPPEFSASVVTVSATNKMSSICGTSMAVFRYSRRVPIRWPSILPAGLAAFLFSFLGARTLSLVDPHLLKPIILIMLIAVAVYSAIRKDFGNLHAPQFTAHRERQFGIVVGAVMGFYDGFFGPGTGSFLMFIFVGLFGFDFLSATASTKVINLAANLSALIYFAAHGNILYQFGLPMGACNMLGSLMGTRLAMLKGNAFIRIFFLVVVTAMIVRFGYEVIFK
ncbi:MAG TPA: TSUP family transporter [Candidatus Eisenbacteria bacterium]|nr:TSUP family transporter [Candidatus Eisenbacteria bacterium]